MTQSKYDELANIVPEKVWNRYGLTESEWAALTAQEREIHYNRQRVCEHGYKYLGVAGDVTDERLREAYSHDPYAHSGHMDPCKRWGIKPPERWAIECYCQMCVGKIGIARDSFD